MLHVAVPHDSHPHDIIRRLRPQVPVEVAHTRLGVTRFRKVSTLARLLAHVRGKSPRKFDHLELLYLPTYAVTLTGQDHTGHLLCDAYEGHATPVDLVEAQWDEDSRPLEFLPRLNPDQAELATREAMARMRWGKTVSVTAPASMTTRIELIGYPYWAYYYQRRFGKLDAKLLDGFTGRLAGPRAKVALLKALASKPGAAAGATR